MSYSYTNLSAVVVKDACTKYIDYHNEQIVKEQNAMVEAHLNKCRKRWWSTIRTENQARKELEASTDWFSPWNTITCKHRWDFDRVFPLLKLARAAIEHSPTDATIFLTSHDAQLLRDFL